MTIIRNAIMLMSDIIIRQKNGTWTEMWTIVYLQIKIHLYTQKME